MLFLVKKSFKANMERKERTRKGEQNDTFFISIQVNLILQNMFRDFDAYGTEPVTIFAYMYKRF